jgi:hypothetical protein
MKNYFKFLLVGFIYFFTIATTCHAASAIEGKLLSYMSRQVSGLSLVAETQTDIKEEKSRAKVTTKSRQDGVFIFTNLLPNKTYKVTLTDHKKFISNPLYITAPPNGTRLSDTPLLFAVMPLQSGIWYYNPKSSQFTSINASVELVPINSMENLGGNAGLGRSGLSAFYIARSIDVDKQSFPAEKGGFLVTLNADIVDFGMLHPISRFGVPDALYYNIQDFRDGKPYYRKASVATSKFEDGGSKLFCLSLQNTDRGIYIVTTKSEQINMSRILGGETAPKEGYLVTVSQGEEYKARVKGQSYPSIVGNFRSDSSSSDQASRKVSIDKSPDGMVWTITFLTDESCSYHGYASWPKIYGYGGYAWRIKIPLP